MHLVFQLRLWGSTTSMGFNYVYGVQLRLWGSTTSMGFNYVYGFNYLTYLIKSVPGFKDVKIRKLESEASVEFIPKERFCFANSFLSLVFRVEWSTDINLRTLHIPGVPRFLDR